MIIRASEDRDYRKVISVIDDWWGGRNMADMLPHLFFKHFGDTCYIMEENGEMIGFLVGFISQTHPEQAYIHFFGIHPDYRRMGYGKKMHQFFFEQVKQRGCASVHLVTSIVNKTSIAYHTKIGFKIEEGDGVTDGVPVHLDYDGIGSRMVLFSMELS